MSGLFVVLFVLVLGIGIALVVIGAIQAKRRREAFAAYAVARGWTYTERDDRWAESFSGHPFGEGHDREVRNILTGVYDGRPALAFDYVFHTTSTSTDAQGRTTSREVPHPYSVMAVDTGVAFPGLRVTPEGFFGRLVGKLLNNDIQLESEDFNRAFTVSCEDRKFASDILHPRLMERLLAEPSLGFGFDRQWILTFSDGQLDLPEIEQRLAGLDGILDTVPEFVWKQVRGS